MFKLIALLKRHSGLSVDAFQQGWRERRGSEICKQLRLRRYVQSHPLPLAYRNGDAVCDGLEELWFDDEAAAREYQGERHEMDRDSLLLSPLSETMAVGTVMVLDGKPSRGSVKSVVLARHKTGMTLKDFFDYWHHRHAVVAGRLPHMRRYEQNPQLHWPWKSQRYDGVSLVWFDSLQDLKAAIDTPEHAATLLDEPNFLEDGGHLPIVLTQEHILIEF
jgi:uncharacterized protein (TIGR02118 family)